MTLLRGSLFVVIAMACGASQANIIEELLARPAIQALLAKQGDVRSILLRCSEPKYQQRNAVACKQAEDAKALAAMPIELRMLMSKPEMAGSMRELCLSAQMGALRNSYLCAELYKAEAGFRQIADQYRTVPTTGGGSQELR